MKTLFAALLCALLAACGAGAQFDETGTPQQASQSRASTTGTVMVRDSGTAAQ